MASGDYEIPKWALEAPDARGIIYNGIPRQYRFDGEQGRFLVGEKDCGTTLVVQLVDCRTTEAERWGRPLQVWLDLVFVDLANVVGVLALKKESAINLTEFFLAELAQTSHARINPQAVQVTLLAEAREGEDGPYYVVVVEDWAFVPEPQFRAVQRWAKTTNFSWIFLGES